MDLRRSLIVFFTLTILLYPARGQEAEESENKIEAPSPDGRFAFRYRTKAKPNTDGQANEEAEPKKQTYDLIDQKSGKVIMAVAKSDSELGPGARFDIEGVLWRADSSAFAVTAYLWKRGSSVFVFVREGSGFRKVKLPDMAAEVPDKVKQGKTFPHVSELDSETAKRWQKDGSLVVEIETIVDGSDGSITAKRHVTLGFDRAGKARILASVINYETKADPDAEVDAAWDKGDFKTVIAIYDRAIGSGSDDFTAYYGRGCAYFATHDWRKAVADLQRHCELRTGEKYPAFTARFFIWLLRARLGEREAADKELAPYLEWQPAEWSEGWHGKTGYFLLGRISEEDFLAALSDNPAEAWFYAGMKRLLDNDRASAAEDFRRSMAAGRRNAEEYQIAAAELKALGG